MGLIVTSEPAAEPVLAADAKTHLRVTTSDDDTYIGTLITVARRRAEIETARAFISQTLKQTLDAFPSTDVIELQRPPLSSVTSVKYYDDNGVLQTLSASAYTVDTSSTPGRIVLKEDQSWPSTDDIPNAVEITYVAGYGAAGANVPAEIVHAIKILVAHWYAAREPVVTGVTPAEMPKTVEYLLAPFRVWW
jgi:uncharacterized phiE125 gp8 family phage protein